MKIREQMDKNSMTDCESQTSQLSFSGGDIENYYKNNKKRMLKADGKKSTDTKKALNKKVSKSSKKKKTENKTPDLIAVKKSPIIQEIMRQ